MESSSRGRLPDFLYIGAAKSASTWIFRSLQAHPEVFVPPAKDVFYFDREYHRGLRWYESFFASAGPRHRCAGELSHFYMYSEEAAQRIRQTVPHVKLIACVRNPIARAWSAYLFKKRNGQATGDFAATLAEHPRIATRGLYAEHLARYRELFGAAQLKILVYDDLEADAVTFGRDLYQFLEVDPDFENPFAHAKVLPASRPRSAAVAALTRRAAKFARRLGMANLLGRLKSSEWVMSMFYARLREQRKARMTPEEHRQLADYYAADVERLSKLLDRDLTHWLAPPADRREPTRREATAVPVA